MASVGIIGVGTMGGPICRNVIAKTHAAVTVFDLSIDAVAACVEAGAKAAGSIAELAATSDVILTSLPMPSHVEAVAAEIAESARPGTVWFDLSTNSPEVVRRLAEDLEARGITLLDAPVSGMAAGAVAGTLTVMVGGDRDAFDAHADILGSFGANVIHSGAVGTGSIAKLLNNLLGLCQAAAGTEGLMLAAAAGVDPGRVADVVLTSSGRSVAFKVVSERVLARDFATSFSLDLCYKDAHLALELADQLGVPTPLGAQAHNLLRSARGLGLGPADSSAMMRVYETTLQREIVRGAELSAPPEAAAVTVARIAFIGVGTMGGRMCRNVIAKSGADVLVFDLNDDAVSACTDAGAKRAATIDEAVRTADVIFTSLPMPRDVEVVAAEIAASARPGTVWFDLSTSSVALARRLGDELGAKGIAFLDSPISGTTAAADAGELTLMVGGDRETFDAYLPLLQTMGANVMHLGDRGSGLIAKLVNNMLLFCNMAAAAEVLMLGAVAAIDVETLIGIMQKSAGDSMGLWAIANRLLVPETPTQFALELAYKDVHLALELADELGVPTPLAADTHNLMRMARGLGLGRSDATLLLQVYETVMQREIVPQPVLA